jgi:hypothetical protein
MSTVKDVFNITRSLFNDDSISAMSDAMLMPKMAIAHIELLTKLALNGIPVTYEETALITVPAGSLDLGDDFPSDMLTPLKMAELCVNDQISNAIPMTKTDFVFNLEQTETLRYWSWIGQQIVFLGSTQDRQILLYYLANVPIPLTVNDPLFFTLSEIFLGPRIAALCVFDKRSDTFNQMAEKNLSSIVRTEVKRAQNLPVRRRPFSYSLKSRRRYSV